MRATRTRRWPRASCRICFAPRFSEITIDAKDSKMAVKAGKSRFSLQTLPAADYPRLTMSQSNCKVLLPQKLLKATPGLVEFAMAQQDIRFYLNGMLFVLDKDQLVQCATDGHRLSYAATMPVEGNPNRQEIIVPRKTVIEPPSCWPRPTIRLPLTSSPTRVRIQFGNIELTSKVIDGKFPDYNRADSGPHTARSSRWIVCCCCTHCNVQRSLSNERFAACASACIRALKDCLYQQRAGRS